MPFPNFEPDPEAWAPRYGVIEAKSLGAARPYIPSSVSSFVSWLFLLFLCAFVFGFPIFFVFYFGFLS